MSDKVTPRILAGFTELLPSEQILFDTLYNKIRTCYESFGFTPLDTPILEYSEVLLAKAGGETEKQIYRFEKGDADISMRFDLTVPLARYVAQHSNDLVFPFKRYQMEKVFRGERPQKGRFREFYQCDIDTIGSGSLDIYYEAEMPAVIYKVFTTLGIGKFTVRINNRKLLNGFFSSLGFGDKIADILRIIDKLDKIGKDAVLSELSLLGTDTETGGRIIDFIVISGSNAEKLSRLASLGIENETFATGLDELTKVTTLITDVFGVPEDYLSIDLSIARGLDYYTGTVYETLLDEHPSIGSVCSGGRYDNLTGFYSNGSYPGIGASIGLSRLFYQLREADIVRPESSTLIKALILPMGEEALKYSVALANDLRDNGITTDVRGDNGGVKQKMKYANRLGVPYVLIIGDDEMQSGKISVKNMTDGTQSQLTKEELMATLKL